MEKRYIGYDVRQKLWWVQILKVIFGAAIALLIKEGFKPLFESWGLGLYIGSFIRYFWWAFGAALALWRRSNTTSARLKELMDNKKYIKEQP